ncbi:hypothetical protein BC940DRAFT_313806, partial [Gongronella butleri]
MLRLLVHTLETHKDRGLLVHRVFLYNIHQYMHNYTSYGNDYNGPRALLALQHLTPNVKVLSKPTSPHLDVYWDHLFGNGTWPLLTTMSMKDHANVSMVLTLEHVTTLECSYPVLYTLLPRMTRHQQAALTSLVVGPANPGVDVKDFESNEM